jgi:hypothetical protein
MKKLILCVLTLATMACREEVKVSPDVQAQCAADAICIAEDATAVDAAVDVSAASTEDVAPAADASDVTASK